jgi:enoyl reductase-like protein
MVTRTPMIAPVMVLLAACGSPAREATTNVAAADDYVARIRALPAGQRDAVLLRAIRDAGNACQQVTASAAIPAVAGAPAWQARCDNGPSWIVAFNPGGVATVTAAANVGKAAR